MRRTAQQLGGAEAAIIPADENLCERQIEGTNQEIDVLVYELYGLTEQEIAIVEEATR